MNDHLYLIFSLVSVIIVCWIISFISTLICNHIEPAYDFFGNTHSTWYLTIIFYLFKVIETLTKFVYIIGFITLIICILLSFSDFIDN